MVFARLLALLEANTAKIRSESLGGRGGGLCTVKGEKVFVVDTQASSIEMAIICAKTIPQLIDIENIYLKPEVREFIEVHSGIGRGVE